jgi:hypothetical protein
MRTPTKAIAAILCLCLCVGLSACKKDDRKPGLSQYEEGYLAGYEAGLWDGAYECKKDFARDIQSLYFDTEGASQNDRYFHAEEAIMVLNDYLDGDYVPRYELEGAIESISDFYYDWQSIMANIEDMDVDIDFN